ncbi:MAG: inositol monophosphatase family protein [Beutenbergiaceae bacterium]
MDTDDVLDLMRQTAEQIITPRFRALAAGEVFEKRPGDLVTVADREAELAMTPVLQRAYPDALILGEEASETEPGLLDAYTRAEHAFTIDPIDGTANFVRGSDDHAVMIAELRSGEVVRSWIWQPEHQLAFVAEQGAGAWCNATRLPQLSPSTEPGQWRGISSQQVLQSGNFEPLAPIKETWFCAGVDYSKLALGEIDYVVFNHAKPWDHVPGSLLLTEVGGRCVRFDGTRYRPNELRFGLLSAAGPEVVTGVRAALSEVLA